MCIKFICYWHFTFIHLNIFIFDVFFLKDFTLYGIMYFFVQISTFISFNRNYQHIFFTVHKPVEYCFQVQFSIVVFTYYPSNYKLMYVHFIQFSLLIWIQHWLELNENKMIAKSKVYKSKSAIFLKVHFWIYFSYL